MCRTTLLEWEKEGLVKPYRTVGNHRRYALDDLLKLVGAGPKGREENKAALIYARVSTKKQQAAGNLERQKKRLIEYADSNGYTVCNVFEEVASGINENRRGLMKMIQYAKANDVSYIIIEYKDRLARFGYNYIKIIFDLLDIKIIITETVENKDLNTEMAEDVLAVITSFSAKLYGRRGANKVKKTLKELKEIS
ncbi:MAG: IS607 family transposase [Clostridium sp.]|nr:IS607 family transposase [Clostridium sp.]